jgi:hypothetical protein
MDKLNPGRLFHIVRDFKKMIEEFARILKTGDKPTGLQGKLDLVNDFFPHRIFLDDLTAEQDAAFDELVTLAKSGDLVAFMPRAEALFHDITDHIYPIRDGQLDFYEFTSIFPAGTYDKTTTHKGRTIPELTTTGVW